MCLILFAWNTHPDYSLVVAANRDEFYERPTSPLGWWADHPQILAGRDQADVIGDTGTWMGLHQDGRFAALTNIRAPSEKNPLLRTRGELTTQFLKSKLNPSEYIHEKSSKFGQYNGFNLLVGELDKDKKSSLKWVSNRAYVGQAIKNNQTLTQQSISPGIYGLSNAMLDAPWPKVTHRIAEFTQTLAMDKGQLEQPEAYIKLLGDTQIAPDERLPQTGVSLEWERALSSAFIQTENYGTRASSILRIRHDGHFQFIETSFNKDGQLGQITKEGQLNNFVNT